MLQCMSVLASMGSVGGLGGVSGAGGGSVGYTAGEWYDEDSQRKMEELCRSLKLNWLGRGRMGRNRRGLVGARIRGPEGDGGGVGCEYVVVLAAFGRGLAWHRQDGVWAMGWEHFHLSIRQAFLDGNGIVWQTKVRAKRSTEVGWSVSGESRVIDYDTRVQDSTVQTQLALDIIYHSLYAI